MAEGQKVGDALTVEYTAAATWSVGDLVNLGGCVGVLMQDMVSGDVGPAAISGAYIVAQETGVAAKVAGAIAFYDFTTGRVEATGAAGVQIGVFRKAAASADATVEVVINVCPEYGELT